MRRVAGVLAALALLAQTTHAVACQLPVWANDARTAEDVVGDAQKVAWARALEPRNDADERGAFREWARFEVIEVLKGEVPAEFTVDGSTYIELKEPTFWSPGTDPALTDDFDGHRGGEPFSGNHRYHFTGGDCSLVPVFIAGESYLIVLDDRHWASYEIVRSEDDLWLQKVRRLIQEQGG